MSTEPPSACARSSADIVADPDPDQGDLTLHGLARRRFLRDSGALTTALAAAGGMVAQPSRAEGIAAPSAATPPVVPAGRAVGVQFNLNGRDVQWQVESRTTLLDGLREYANMPGTKKGCDRGQCGACTVLVNGRRINACLSLAIAHQGDHVVTIEGLAGPAALHPLQQAFITHDGFQCGYCTPGQICSAVALLDEARRGDVSAATADVGNAARAQLLDDAEIRERMSGNLCRCGAYAGIVAAIRSVAGRNGGG